MSEPRFLAGALIRRSVRRELLVAGIPFREEKGILDSLFILHGATEGQLRAIKDWIDRINAE